MSPRSESDYRIYRVVPDTNGMELEVVRSFGVYGDTTEGDIVEELKKESPGEYVVYPSDALREYTVRALVEQTVRNGESIGARDNRFVQ